MNNIYQICILLLGLFGSLNALASLSPAINNVMISASNRVVVAPLLLVMSRACSHKKIEYMKKDLIEIDQRYAELLKQKNILDESFFALYSQMDDARISYEKGDMLQNDFKIVQKKFTIEYLTIKRSLDEIEDEMSHIRYIRRSPY